MVAPKLPYKDDGEKQVLVIHLPKLKFIVLEFDEDIQEFKQLCIFNFENEDQFKVTGKRFPLQGLLRSVSTHWFSSFGFIADDSVFSWVQFQDSFMQKRLTKLQIKKIESMKKQTNQYGDEKEQQEV